MSDKILRYKGVPVSNLPKSQLTKFLSVVSDKAASIIQEFETVAAEYEKRYGELNPLSNCSDQELDALIADRQATVNDARRRLRAAQALRAKRIADYSAMPASREDPS